MHCDDPHCRYCQAIDRRIERLKPFLSGTCHNRILAQAMNRLSAEIMRLELLKEIG